MTTLMCTVCKATRPGERTMYEHLKAEHGELMRGHLNIVDNFSCEKGSVMWRKLSSGEIKPLDNNNKTEVKTQ